MSATPKAGKEDSEKPRVDVKAWLWNYAIAYVFLFGLYFYASLTGKETLSPATWLSEKAAQSSGLLGGWDGVLPAKDRPNLDKEIAALYQKYQEDVSVDVEGLRPLPAQIIFAEPYTLILPNGEKEILEEGARLTRLQAIALAGMVVKGIKSPGMVIAKETFLYRLDWPYWLNILNVFGFFMLVGLFLWNPICGALQDMADKAAIALKKARDAQKESEDLAKQFSEVEAEIESKKKHNAETLANDIAEEKNNIISAANHEAETLEAHVASSIEVEIVIAKNQLKFETSRAALAEARQRIEKSSRQETHNVMIDEFIRDLAKAKI
jgi:F-type H+-transporting ATPase subunit b